MENYRPSRLVFVVITDGQENASREVRRDRILKMIRDKEAGCGGRSMPHLADLQADQTGTLCACSSFSIEAVRLT